jgi:hypothetical protein
MSTFIEACCHNHSIALKLGRQRLRIDGNEQNTRGQQLIYHSLKGFVSC